MAISEEALQSLVNRIKAGKKGRFALFLGAGASVTTGIPVAKKLTELHQKLCFARPQGGGDDFLPFSLGRESQLNKFLKKKKGLLTKFVAEKEREFRESLDLESEEEKKRLPHRLRKGIESYREKLAEEGLYGFWFGQYSGDEAQRRDFLDEWMERLRKPGKGYLFLSQFIAKGLFHDIVRRSNPFCRT